MQRPKMNGNSHPLVSVMYMGFSLFAVCVCVVCLCKCVFGISAMDSFSVFQFFQCCMPKAGTVCVCSRGERELCITSHTHRSSPSWSSSPSSISSKPSSPPAGLETPIHLAPHLTSPHRNSAPLTPLDLTAAPYPPCTSVPTPGHRPCSG